jgi:hypothetical protein
MSCVVPMHAEAVAALKGEHETGPGYHIVSVELKDGRCFDQVIVSEGCIISVRGHNDIPFDFNEVASIEINHRRWNFRKWTDAPRAKARAASA